MVYILIGIVGGAILGGLIGRAGAKKCTTGACPFTSTPGGGILLGAIVGGLIGWSVNVSVDRRQPTADNLPHIATVEQFDQDVIGSEQPVLVDFYADWCGPCRQLAPTIAAIAAEYKGKARVIKVNVDQAQDLARKYTIKSIPTIILFHDGRAVGRWGFRDKFVYTQAMDQYLKDRPE